MAFPQTPLDVRVHIAPGGDPAADPATWTLVDITDDVRVASGITISAGRADEGNRVDPGKCTLTLDNRSGNYCTRNVYGQWYGTLAKGTPLRVGTGAVTDAFGRTVSSGWGSTDQGLTWSRSGSSALWSVSTSGGGQLAFNAANVANAATAVGAELLDIDAQFTASVPAVMTGASQVMALMFRYVDGSNFYMASCEFDTGGTVTAKLRSIVGGVFTEIATASVPALTYTAGQKLRVRVQADGPALRARVWADGGTEPAAWHVTATDTSIDAAGRVGFYFWCVSGNTNTKPYTVAVDSLDVEAVEFTGAVYEWPPRWDQSRRDATAPITASGILRRLQQGKSPLRSPIARMILRQGAIELWPFEDDSQATYAATALAGGVPAVVRAVEFGQDDPDLAGAKQTTGVTASTVMTYRVRPHTATGVWAVVWFAYLLAPPAAQTTIMSVYATGTVRRFDVALDSGGYLLFGYDASGTLIYSSSALYDPLAKPPMWIAFDLLVTQSGGNIDAKLLMYGVNSSNGNTAVFFGTTVAGTVGSPTGGRLEGSLGYNEGSLGALAVFNAEPAFVTGEFFDAANGYAGEQAADRVTRLCAEEGVQVVVEDGDSSPLGAQATDTFLSLLYSAEEADLGILYERGAGLGYRPRGARYNRTVDLPLDFAVGDVAEAPEPTDDDQQLKNQWTVSRDSGSSAIAADQTSIDACGLLDDSVTVNVATDDVLPDHASWRLATTTVDELRWPSIKLDLARNTSQIRLWRAAQPFPRVTVANEPTEVAGNDVDVTVLGYTQTLGPFGWDIDLNCTPSTPYGDVGVYGSSRYDSASTTTTGTLTAVAGSGVSLPISTVTRTDCWSTTAVPYTVTVTGEAMTVTAMTSPSGSGPYTQTATVTRAANGILKAHATGERFGLATPKRYAL